MRYNHLIHLELEHELEKVFGDSYSDINVEYNTSRNVTTVYLIDTPLAEIRWGEITFDYDSNLLTLIARRIYNLYSNRSLRSFGCFDKYLI